MCIMFWHTHLRTTHFVQCVHFPNDLVLLFLVEYQIYLYFISQIYIITLSANNLRKTSQERDKVQFNFNTSEILTESKCPLTFQKIKTFLNFCYQLRMVKIETSLVAHTSPTAHAYSSMAQKVFFSSKNMRKKLLSLTFDIQKTEYFIKIKN